jgi:hypothetical protein
VAPHYLPLAATPYYRPAPSAPRYGTPAWDCTALIAALNNTAIGSSNNGGWVMDSGATSHMVLDPDIISSPTPPSFPSHVTAGNGVSLPISTTGHATLSTPHHTFCLNNVLVVPSIIKNLLSTRQFTIDNIVLWNMTRLVFPLRTFKHDVRSFAAVAPGRSMSSPPAQVLHHRSSPPPPPPSFGINVWVIQDMTLHPT